ncbi:transposase [Deltaproteobacteria bacterium TL4]
MIATTYEEVHSDEWKKTHIPNVTHELILFNKFIPWSSIIQRLSCFYKKGKGAMGKSLRVVVALLILSKLRELSDRKVISAIQENRYMQYFCNVTDTELRTFLHPSSLSVIRSRLGSKGVDLIEEEVFRPLRKVGAINNDSMLTDSSVLENKIIYPNDVRLVMVALKKIKRWSTNHGQTLSWSNHEVKQIWREFHQTKKASRRLYLVRFYLIFEPALAEFERLAQQLEPGTLAYIEAKAFLEVFKLLEEQTRQKLRGETHIKNRLVSLHEIQARPIKKGKLYPDCEFGVTNQMAFNRQGFMITCDIFEGKPADRTLYQATLDKYIKRMNGVPKTAVTDGGYRSKSNLNYRPEGLEPIFMGRSEDVLESQQEECRKARSATEGFIAIAKNLRGFRRSLYRGLEGDKIWARLCQVAYNLKKFLQLYLNEDYEEEVLVKLGVWT